MVGSMLTPDLQPSLFRPICELNWLTDSARPVFLSLLTLNSAISNPLHIVFLIWIKFYCTIRCQLYCGLAAGGALHRERSTIRPWISKLPVLTQLFLSEEGNWTQPERPALTKSPLESISMSRLPSEKWRTLIISVIKPDKGSPSPGCRPGGRTWDHDASWDRMKSWSQFKISRHSL